MNKDEIVSFLKEHKKEMGVKYGVKKIGLFGSYVRGEVRKDSDIDIAVELNDKHIFRNFFALEEFLKTHLNKKVDLGIESAIKPAVKKQILDEIVYV